MQIGGLISCNLATGVNFRDNLMVSNKYGIFKTMWPTEAQTEQYQRVWTWLTAWSSQRADINWIAFVTRFNHRPFQFVVHLVFSNAWNMLYKTHSYRGFCIAPIMPDTVNTRLVSSRTNSASLHAQKHLYFI